METFSIEIKGVNFSFNCIYNYSTSFLNCVRNFLRINATNLETMYCREYFDTEQINRINGYEISNEIGQGNSGMNVYDSLKKRKRIPNQ